MSQSGPSDFTKSRMREYRTCSSSATFPLETGVRSKVALSLMFSLTAAFLSAFLDALTVTAVIITVAVGFFGVYHKVASGTKLDLDHDPSTDKNVAELHRADLEQFRAFLRSLMMHGAVGTALGGVTTLVK